jgi:DNA polymerase-3 subunit gamma/tau
LVEMRGATSPRLLLELLVARMLLPAADESASAVLQRLERLESGAALPLAADSRTTSAGRQPTSAAAADTSPAGRRSSPSGAAAGGATSGSRAGQPDDHTGEPSRGQLPGDAETDWPAGAGNGGAGNGGSDGTATDGTAASGAARTVPAPTRSPESTLSTMDGATTGGIDAATVRRVWEEIVRHVGQASKKAAAFAREAVVREIEGDTLVLLFKHKIHADGVNGEPAPLLAAVSQVVGGAWRVRCEVGGDQRGASVSRPASAPPAAAAPSRAGAKPSTAGKAAGGPAARTASATASTATAASTTTAGKGSRTRRATTTPEVGETSPATADDWPTTAKIGGGPAHDDEPPLTDEDVPYDPEFDGPPARAAQAPMHEGFDPGDEPDLDTDSLAVKQTSEEQALESLKQSFELEKIAEKGS